MVGFIKLNRLVASFLALAMQSAPPFPPFILSNRMLQLFDTLVVLLVLLLLLLSKLTGEQLLLLLLLVLPIPFGKRPLLDGDAVDEMEAVADVDVDGAATTVVGDDDVTEAEGGKLNIG